MPGRLLSSETEKAAPAKWNSSSRGSENTSPTCLTGSSLRKWWMNTTSLMPNSWRRRVRFTPQPRHVPDHARRANSCFVKCIQPNITMKNRHDASAQTPEELLQDLRTLISDAETLLGDSVKEHSAEAIDALRSRL